MKGIICEKPGSLKEIEVQMPAPKENESLLKIKRVGICGTDLHAYAGNQAFFSYPRILGHELSGEIVEINGVSDLKIGQQVVIIPYMHCGTCVACKQGKTNCCSTLKVIGVHIDGGMQEYIAYPTDLLLPAKGLSIEEMALVEPLSIGTHAVRRAQIKPGDWIAVSGCGPIGVGILWAAMQEGARVIALDIDKERLRWCGDWLGVKHTIQASDRSIEEISKRTDGDMVRVAFDATGIKGPMETGVNYIGSGGTYVLVGLNKGDLTFNHPQLHSREISVLCSRNATRSDFELVVSRLESRSFPSDKYISHTEAFESIPGKFDFWKNPVNQVMKAMTIW